MTKQLQKRYQFFGKNGVEWSPWFNYTGDTTNTVQLQGKTTLKNEYRTIETK